MEIVVDVGVLPASANCAGASFRSSRAWNTAAMPAAFESDRIPARWSNRNRAWRRPHRTAGEGPIRL